MRSQPADTSLIKKPHLQISYSREQAEELLKCSDPVTGPLYFMTHFFYIQHPTKGKLLFDPFEFQVRLIDTYNNYRHSIALCPRQVGKSVTAAGYLLWYAMFKPDSTILIAAHKMLGASEIMNRIRYAYESVPDHIRCGVNDYNKQSIAFDNGSRIAAQTTTETTGRGMSITLLYIDEFAFVRPTIAKEFWTSISLTLSTGGRCIITSTPNSDEDQFAEIWRQANKCFDVLGNTTDKGINGFKAFRSYWNEHPDRDEKWLEEQRQTIGEERVRRELECEFLIYEETLINQIYLTTMKGIEPISNEGQIRWYKQPDPTKTYLIALDPSLCTGGDPAAIQVFESPNLTQVAEWTHNKTPIEKQVSIMASLTEKLDDITGNLNKVYYTVENNTIGEAALVSIRNYGEENIRGIFISELRKAGNASRTFRKGLNTSNSSKLAACSLMKHAIEHDKVKIYSKKLISELKTFIAVGNSFKAKVGERDDLVMSAICIIRMVQILKNFVPAVDDDYEEQSEDYMPMPFVSVTY